MDKLNNYRQLIRQIINEYAQMKPSNGDIQVYTFCDEVNDHYQVFHAGWDGYQRIFGALIHLDLIEGKIWIQYDGTEIGVANDLVALGVAKEDIVLAYHSPFMRQFDGFAVG
ncbi:MULTISPECIES: XisI protein [unclassified Tolypothrix]|uniref:XisI protein n=1 Tax=unclassified Tolypothrix TaxID=2649714 RepID=UPI0005EAAE3C|nr:MULTISPECIES: XisI protein [unclassified Tolypothrix]BAY94258.1 fdxN element excision controlling factor protein [Microchaete diplosiphon NIES-3275]EKF03995.1 heterocyst differentiation protein [Tolypothrix sp. PCC 7601]MBE9087172.1 XisI protein [Tolypothrix sp. LEGE 11397]UYD28000.1 XisI protein [Tolypothrix sp. PCC 7712]UYD36129.1 XisI protein [Tolypothrix sp. PCC 7601]